MPWRSSNRCKKRNGPRTEQLEEEFDVYRNRADKLLNVLDVWEQDLKEILADCNKQYEEAKYTRDVENAINKILRLNENLNALDREMRECGLFAAPRRNYGKKRWY